MDSPGREAFSVVSVLRVEHVSVHFLGHVIHMTAQKPAVGDIPFSTHVDEQGPAWRIVLAVREVPHRPSGCVCDIEMVQLLCNPLVQKESGIKPRFSYGWWWRLPEEASKNILGWFGCRGGVDASQNGKREEQDHLHVH